MKRIDKWACRRVAKEHIRIHPGNALLYIPSIKYVLRSAVRNITGKRLLVVYMISPEKAAKGDTTPQYVLFQGKDDFVTLENCDDGTFKWRRSNIRYLDDIGKPLGGDCAFLSKRDQDRVLRFCKDDGTDAVAAISYRQWHIRQKQSDQNRIRKKHEIAALMEPVNRRALPKGLLPWIERDVFPAHVIYQYQKRKKQQIGYCTHCKSEVLLDSPRNGRSIVCPNCKVNATAHASGRMGGLYERETVQVLQRVGKTLVARICKATVSFRDYRNPRISVWETARFFFSEEKGRYCEREFYYSYTDPEVTPWKKGSRPTRSRWCYYYEADNCGHLYPKNLTATLKGTPWQYCQIKEFYLHDACEMDIAPYMRSFYYGPALEYMVKLGLFRLATAAVYGEKDQYYHKTPCNMKGKNLREVLGVGKAELPVLQEVDANSHTLYLLQKLIQKKFPWDTTLLQWCQKHAIYDEEQIVRCMEHTSSSKVMDYLDRQVMDVRANCSYDPYKIVFGWYHDYVRFCAELGYDLADDFIRFPRDIKDAHDRASEMFDRRKVQKYNEKIAEQYEQLAAKYQMNEAGLMVIPPRTAEEIVEEGQKLHHCVGGYVSRVVKDECTILFLRSAKQPEVPFYTMEIRDGEVKQLRGSRNCKPTPEIDSYMERWKKEKLLPAVKQAA